MAARQPSVRQRAARRSKAARRRKTGALRVELELARFAVEEGPGEWEVVRASVVEEGGAGMRAGRPVAIAEVPVAAAAGGGSGTAAGTRRGKGRWVSVTLAGSVGEATPVVVSSEAEAERAYNALYQYEVRTGTPMFYRRERQGDGSYVLHLGRRRGGSVGLVKGRGGQ